MLFVFFLCLIYLLVFVFAFFALLLFLIRKKRYTRLLSLFPNYNIKFIISIIWPSEVCVTNYPGKCRESDVDLQKHVWGSLNPVSFYAATILKLWPICCMYIYITILHRKLQLGLKELNIIQFSFFSTNYTRRCH